MASPTMHLSYFLWMSVNVIPNAVTLKWTMVGVGSISCSKVEDTAFWTAALPVRVSIVTECRYKRLHTIRQKEKKKKKKVISGDYFWEFFFKKEAYIFKNMEGNRGLWDIIKSQFLHCDCIVHFKNTVKLVKKMQAGWRSAVKSLIKQIHILPGHIG